MSIVETTTRMLDTMPPYWNDAMMVATLDALGREIDRLNAIAEGLRFTAYPQNADDTYGMLPYWERLFELAVQPDSVTIDQRRAAVLAHIRKRQVAAGSDWEASLRAILGNSWSYVEDSGLYRVTITIPFASGSFGASTVETLAADVTPAHIDIRVVYDVGFLIGFGLVGIDRL